MKRNEERGVAGELELSIHRTGMKKMGRLEIGDAPF